MIEPVREASYLARCHAAAPEALLIRVDEVRMEPLAKPRGLYDVALHAQVEILEVIRSSEGLRKGGRLAVKYEGWTATVLPDGFHRMQTLVVGQQLTAFLGRRSDGYFAPVSHSAFLREWRWGTEWRTEGRSAFAIRREHPLLRPTDRLVPTLEESFAETEALVAGIKRKQSRKESVRRFWIGAAVNVFLILLMRFLLWKFFRRAF